MDLYGDLQGCSVAQVNFLQGKQQQGQGQGQGQGGGAAKGGAGVAQGAQAGAKMLPAALMRPRQTAVGKALPRTLVPAKVMTSSAIQQNNQPENQPQQPHELEVAAEESGSPKDTGVYAMEEEYTASFDSSDPYNPLRPNDYLQLCAERAERKRQEEIQAENRRLMEALEQERIEREMKRKRVVEEGDLTKVQALLSAGRGRGRGISNMPAWMTAAGADSTGLGISSASNKESEATAASSHNMSSDSNSNRGIVFNASNYQSGEGPSVPPSAAPEAPTRRRGAAASSVSCILLLRNMVVRGDVDEYLEGDTISECSKFGPVKSCRVYEDPNPQAPLEDSVRVFVEFESQESAARAYKEMNGRFFGGRQVKAGFFPEALYHSGALGDQ